MRNLAAFAFVLATFAGIASASVQQRSRNRVAAGAASGRDTGMRIIFFIALVVIVVMASLLPKGSAEAAVLTCAQTWEMDDAHWNNDFVRSLRDQGLRRPATPACGIAILTGEISKGDARTLETTIQANLPFLGELALNSNGGDLAEAMQIGRIARRYYLSTESPTTYGGKRQPLYFLGHPTALPGATCVSACFFAWLGGVNRTGDVLGIHRPFPSPNEMSKLSPGDAEHLYQKISREILDYLSEMDAQPHWLYDMIRIPPDQIYMLAPEQISRELQGDAHAYFDLPSLAQWKSSKCGALTAEEFDDLWDMARQAALPQPKQGYYHYLEEKGQRILTCGAQALMLARWQLRAKSGSD